MDAKTWTIATYATTGAGLLLLAVSYLMPYVLPERGAWSEENANEYSASAADLHRLTHMHGDGANGHSHGTPSNASAHDSSAAELAAARARFAESQARLDAAIAGRQRLRTIVKWLGIVTAAVGLGIGVFARLRELND